MGFFGKKKEKPENRIIAGTNAIYYDGGLQGFSVNDSVVVLLNENALTVMKRGKEKEPLVVTLDKSRIIGMDFYDDERQYMLRYHGDAATTHKQSKLLGVIGAGKAMEEMFEKIYFVINYTARDGTQKHLDFWCAKMESIKVMLLKNKLMATTTHESYEI